VFFADELQSAQGKAEVPAVSAESEELRRKGEIKKICENLKVSEARFDEVIAAAKELNQFDADGLKIGFKFAFPPDADVNLTNQLIKILFDGTFTLFYTFSLFYLLI
jgi:hypothetical protein